MKTACKNWLRLPGIQRRRGREAFTLLELLAVIAIIGILAAIALPNISKFKPNVMAAGTRQMLDAIARGRQLALSQRTTVYMVFVPQAFMFSPVYSNSLPVSEQVKGISLFDRQGMAYNFISLRSMGDQPGQSTTRYLDTWKNLPEGVMIPYSKFFQHTASPVMSFYTNNALGVKLLAFEAHGFHYTNNIPFPSEEAIKYTKSFVPLPYIAFDYMGRLETGKDEFIPLALGTVTAPRNAFKEPQGQPATWTEAPVGNATNMFNLIQIDWLTGRARVHRQEIQ